MSMTGSIVVIDDEEGVLNVLGDLLEMEGYAVHCLDRPENPEAIRAAVEPCLFLIDIMLPGMSGIEMAQELRSGPFRDTPMIAMSASDFMVKAAKNTGLFQQTVRKPFDLDRLLDAVKRYVG